MSFGKIKVTDFGKRHFDPKFGGTKITDKTVEEFEEVIERKIQKSLDFFGEEELTHCKILEGYAPFCKLVVVSNFTNAKVGSMPIVIENYQYLRSGYSARTEKELPVLSRWFELPVPVPIAEYLVVVLYSKEQVDIEAKSDTTKPFVEFDADWGIVAVLGQTHSNEEPMAPITMMRNALGVEEGGSGVPIDKIKYQQSVEFWKNNAIVKS